MRPVTAPDRPSIQLPHLPSGGMAVSARNHPTEPLHGWSMVTALLAMLGALGGILVALVIKHADGLAKNLATASSIVLTTLASHFLFHGPLSAPIGLACLVVIVAGYMYQKVP